MKQPKLLTYPMGAGVVAFSTTRHGGYSCGPYAELNINRYCGDDAEAIRRNREALCGLLGICDERLMMPHQTHGTRIVAIDEVLLALQPDEQAAALEATDAVMTNLAEVCIGVSTADCIPILLYDKRRQVVCAIHAGWRGTVGRIVTKAVAAMTTTYGTHPDDLTAQIGPGISLDSFEVGQEVYDAFLAAGFSMDAISRRYPTTDPTATDGLKWHIDLPECNRRQLVGTGVPAQNIGTSGICTYRQSADYFSARRLGIHSGRIFTGIMLRP